MQNELKLFFFQNQADLALWFIILYSKALYFKLGMLIFSFVSLLEVFQVAYILVY